MSKALITMLDGRKIMVDGFDRVSETLDYATKHSVPYLYLPSIVINVRQISTIVRVNADETEDIR